MNENYNKLENYNRLKRDGEPVIGQKPDGIDVTTGVNGSKYYLIFVLYIFVMFGLLMNDILNIVVLIFSYISFIIMLFYLYNRKKKRCNLKLLSEVVYVTKKVVRSKDGSKECWNVFYRYMYNGQIYYFCNLISRKFDYPSLGTLQEVFINSYKPNDGMIIKNEKFNLKRIFIMSLFWVIIFGAFAFVSG